MPLLLLFIATGRASVLRSKGHFMNQEPLVSIVVPVYNVESCLDYCLTSLLEQTYQSFELLLIDDGSTDASGDLCESWAKRDSRIRVFHKANGGLSDARNYGIERIRGDFLTFVDSDDYVSPAYLSALVSALLNHPGYGMVGCRIKSVHRVSSVKETAHDYGPIQTFSCKDAFESALYNGKVDVSGCGKIYRRCLFEDVRFPVGRLYEDTFTFGSLLRRSGRYLYIDQPLYFYMKRRGSIVNTEWSVSKLEFIEAAERLVADALSCSDDLRRAAIRKETQAYLSVLRYMPWRIGDNNTLFASLREKALAHAGEVLGDSRAPKRDKVALRILRLGLKPYRLCWGFYQWIKTVTQV